jgi:hypothetical protein
MSLYDAQVVAHYQNDYNFGSNAVTVSPDKVSNVEITLTYKGFGYGWGETTRAYLESCSWGPDESVYAVYNERVICLVYPTFAQVKDLGVSIKGMDYNSVKNQWVAIAGGKLVVMDSTFNLIGTIITNEQLHTWTNNNSCDLGSVGINNTGIRVVTQWQASSV